MNTTTAEFSRIDRLKQSLPESPDESDFLDALETTLVADQDFHRLFDAKLIRFRKANGLGLSQPTSLENVPAEQEKAFRDAYMTAAREVGHLFLQNGQLSDAWAYFRTIGDQDALKPAIDKIRIPKEPDEAFDEIMNVALYEGAHMTRGLEFLLKTHGTCNTVTAFSQLQAQMTQSERRTAAAMMVRSIYEDLQQSLRRDVENRMPVLNPHASIQELITGRDWLFAEGNYHIDVSHLHSTVGFARALEADDKELTMAIELCQYGSMLSGPLQYPGDVPFDEYYKAHRHFLQAIAGQEIDAGLQYFQQRLKDEPDEPDQQLISFVLLDLANRVGRAKEVLKETATLVSRMEDPNGFSFTKMCVDMGLSNVLEEAALANDDILAFTIAKLSTGASTTA